MANAAAKNTRGGAANPKAAAKDAKAKAKAAKKAEKARKKASNDPKDMGRIRQIGRAYQVTHEYDRALPYLLLGGFLLPIAISVVVGLLWGHAFNLIFAGVMIGVLAAMFMLVRRAKRATYKRYAGTGRLGRGGPANAAQEVDLHAGNRRQPPSGRHPPHPWPRWSHTHRRGRSRPGPPTARERGEEARTGRIWSHSDPVIMGNKDGQVPLDKLADHIRKMPKALQAHQITDIRQRLRALDALRPPVPVPKGPMPTSPRQVKGVRQAMRGR